MQCPKCRKQVEGDSLFCNHCGSYLHETMDQDFGLQGMRPRKSRRHIGWLILLGLLVLVVLVGFGVGSLIAALIAPNDGAIAPLPTPSATQLTLTTAPAVTDAPKATPIPALTDAPAATDVPSATDIPAATDAPAATDTPAATDAPSATATKAPAATPKPTAKPTAAATVKPTAVPTAKPTPVPTVKPTAAATAKPTAKPTEKPTAKPAATPAVSPIDGEYMIADSDTRKLTREELESMTFMQLVHARNEIYARHGYIFKDPKLVAYFDARRWYEPDPSFKMSRLSSVERQNISLIKEVENTKD